VKRLGPALTVELLLATPSRTKAQSASKVFWIGSSLSPRSSIGYSAKVVRQALGQLGYVDNRCGTVLILGQAA
jgi:hypothetical protein